MAQIRATRAGFVLALVSAVLPGAGQTRWVDDDACPGTGSGSEAAPYCSIQQAICDLAPTGGGTVHVLPGHYNESLRMLPGVSVVSTDGPEVTTIDGAGRPCTTAACTTSTTALACAVVVWGSGSTEDDRIEGFRITGGTGLHRDFDGDRTAVAGGGVFIYNSSPTITRNEISGNTLFDKTSSAFWGAGIYVGGGSYSEPARPVITNNLIENNSAVPTRRADGTVATDVEAVGGGIYVGIFTAPTIIGNVIQSNRAGDTLTLYGLGGGISSYAVSPYFSPTIARNVIRCNIASDGGGGIFFGEAYEGNRDLPVRGRVESNLIESNESDAGGGMLTHDTLAEIRNNTLADNLASIGAGLAIYGTYNAPVLADNIFAFNESTLDGGGIAVYLEPAAVSNNDLFGNLPNQVGGARTDADYLGGNGNLSIDPLFVSRATGARDLRLQSDSPLIDAGNDGAEIGQDLDGWPRSQDGNGDGMPRIDLGAHEFGPDADQDGVPDAVDNCRTSKNAPQVDSDGDGIGNDCDADDDNDGVPDLDDADPLDARICADTDGDSCDDCSGWANGPRSDGPDYDLDGICDAGDADDDGDGVPDVEDCAPLTPGVSAPPGTIGTSLRLDRGVSGTVLSWRRAEQGHTSNVYRGTIGSGETWDENPRCEAAELAGTSVTDTEVPQPNTAFYYRVRSNNLCGESPDANGAGACPPAGRDSDGDSVADIADNCPLLANPLQVDSDGNGRGDVCDCPDDGHHGIDEHGVCVDFSVFPGGLHHDEEAPDGGPDTSPPGGGP